MSVLSELQKLLTKMGGTPQSGDNTDETVRKITAAYSGGGLPPYENEDINKVLTLADSGETGTGTFVTIREQTVTTDNRFHSASLQIDYTYWALGRTVHLTVNGNNYDCIINTGDFERLEIQAIVDGHEVKIYKKVDGTTFNFSGYEGTTYTVSATIEAPVPIPAPKWEAPPSAPFFIFISEESSGDTETAETILVADKTPSETTAAFNSGRAIYVNDGYGSFPVSGITYSHGKVIINTQNISVESDGVHLSELSLVPHPTDDEYRVSWEEATYPSENNGD